MEIQLIALSQRKEFSKSYVSFGYIFNIPNNQNQSELAFLYSIPKHKNPYKDIKRVPVKVH